MSRSPRVSQTDSNAFFEDRSVRAVFEIDRGGPCVMDDLDGIVDADVRFHDGYCQCDVTFDAGGEDESAVSRRYYSNSICDHCPGVVFLSYGCLPWFLRVDTGSVQVRTFASDTSIIADLVEDLRSVSDRVQLVSLTDSDGQNAFSESLELDVSVLTAKQRDALERAIEMGYYDRSGGKTLEELSTEFDISKSALSQRLSRAEEKLMRQIL